MQSNFLGGMNTASSAHTIAENEYFFGRNIRIRANAPEAIRKPVRIDGNLSYSNLQGIGIAGDYLLVFADGKAFYRDLRTDDLSYVQIPNFVLSAEASKVYNVLVPASRSNMLRTAADTESVARIASTLSATPAALLVQDGVSQPVIINDQAIARRVKTYADWSLSDREYVPVAKQMVWDGDILFAVAPDGKAIYRSVTGRPLDFVVAIDNNGNKLLDASGTYHTVDYNVVTAIAPASSGKDVRLVVGNTNATRMMIASEPVFYGEPLFSNPLVMPSGPLNDESTADIGGDTAIIDANGLRSFNATRQLQTESNNDVFSAAVSQFFGTTTEQDRIIQGMTAAVNFDNYAFFACNTKYGYGILVYDIGIRKFVSFDQYAGIGEIHGYRVAKVNNVYRLFFYTKTGIYEAFVSDEYETATLYPREMSFSDGKTTIFPHTFTVYFNPVRGSGTIEAFAVSDRIVAPLGARKAIEPENPVDSYPLGNNIEARATPFLFNVSRIPRGTNIGIRIEWNFPGYLQSITSDYTVYRANGPETAAVDRSDNVRRVS